MAQTRHEARHAPYARPIMSILSATFTLLALAGLASFACSQGTPGTKADAKPTKPMKYSKAGHDLTPLPSEKIAVIVKGLEPLQVEVTQKAGTECVFTGKY